MPNIIIVNACSILPDDRVSTYTALLDKFDRAVFAPALSLDEANYTFLPRSQIANIPSEAWPIFLNDHSDDPGALGWHDDATDKIFSRVFVGDCERAGVSWQVDISHEAFEMRADPTINKTVTLPSGAIAAYEVCDPVEDDLYAIDYTGAKISDFVLPEYYTSPAGPWDYGKHLQGSCPTLTSGGYISLYENGQWTQKFARTITGHQSYRSARLGRNYRRARP